MDQIAAEGKEPLLQGKVRESGAHRNKHKENNFRKILAQKTRGVEFHGLLQPAGLKDWSLEIPRIG